MKRFTTLLAGLMLALLVACSTTGGTSSGIPTGTFNDKAAIGIESVTAIRQTATALLVAKKITVAQDQTIQAGLDVARKGIEVAKSLQAGDPVGAAAQLTAALATIDALRTQTGATP